LGLVGSLVPGATPKKPASGLIAKGQPSAPNFIQAMSSPIVSTCQPGRVGTSMARFVLPHADGMTPHPARTAFRALPAVAELLDHASTPLRLLAKLAHWQGRRGRVRLLAATKPGGPDDA